MTEGDVELATLSKFNSSSHPITVPHQLESAIKSGAPPLPPHPRQALPRKDEYILPGSQAEHGIRLISSCSLGDSAIQ